MFLKVKKEKNVTANERTGIFLRQTGNLASRYILPLWRPIESLRQYSYYFFDHGMECHFTLNVDIYQLISNFA